VTLIKGNNFQGHPLLFSIQNLLINFIISGFNQIIKKDGVNWVD